MAKQAQAERALNRHEQMLSKLKNVVGLGIVPTEETEDQQGSQELAVAVYVTKKMPLGKLSSQDQVPKSLTISGKSGDITVPVRVIEQGLVQKESLGKETL